MPTHVHSTPVHAAQETKRRSWSSGGIGKICLESWKHGEMHHITGTLEQRTTLEQRATGFSEDIGRERGAGMLLAMLRN